jgi:hypothetical protein
LNWTGLKSIKPPPEVFCLAGILYKTYFLFSKGK